MVPQWLNAAQINIIVDIQRIFSPHASLLNWLSFFGDPRNCFLITFPIFMAFNRRAGFMILWVAAIAEWSNAVLKWIFMDDRPYWWVFENSQYVKKEITLSQFPVTCETGPGFPSGHVMAISSTSTLALMILHKQLQRRFSKVSTFIMTFFMLLFFVMLTVGVCICRLFLAAHFPHQVVVAVFVGISIAIVIWRACNLDHSVLLTSHGCFLGSGLMAVIAVLMYYGLQYYGLDPLSTVDKALKWCHQRSWVHLDTTPFFSLSRDIGAVFGLGIGNYVYMMCYTKNINKNKHLSTNGLNNYVNVSNAIVGFVTCYLVEKIPLYVHKAIFLYAMSFTKFMFISATISGMLPLCFERKFGIPDDKKTL